jgi:hypothetical protein
MSSPTTAAKHQLIDELAHSAENVNILRVRRLCRDNPGLVASAGLRVKVWTILLLGSNTDNYDGKDIEKITVDCEEQHVLDADINRTRSDVEEFRRPEWRTALADILQNFCLSHNVQYKQGMNEVLAPFLMTHPPSSGTQLSYSLFEAFLYRYLERYFCVDESYFLFKSFRMFHLLLLYVDPQLALHLEEQDFPPELYSPQWFLTLYSRALPLPHVLRLWDMLIAIDDPSFTFFIGLCLLRRKRDALLLAEVEKIPEIISDMSFKGEEEVDSVVMEAVSLYNTTPKCFLRHLRLCSVSTTDLTPHPAAAVHNIDRVRQGNANNNTRISHELDRHQSIQSARSCLVLSAQDLVNSVSPIVSSFTSSSSNPMNTVIEEESPLAEETGLDNTEGDTKREPAQFVIIDMRSFDDSALSGGGTIPRAIQLEPEFLNKPDAFEIWIQHFDCTKGCNITIIDLPPSQWTGYNLWKRLLLGEGDGTQSSSPLVSSKTTNNIHSLDEDSPYAKDEQDIVVADEHRPAMILAKALQRHSFNNVSVVEGGFPLVVEQLLESRGTVEPFIINHDSEKWIKFLKNTGREYNTLAASMAARRLLRKQQDADINFKNSKVDPQDRNPQDARRLSDLSLVEIHRAALRAAERLGHKDMILILKAKIGEVDGFDDDDDDDEEDDEGSIEDNQ